VFPDNLATGTAGGIEAARRQGEIESRELRRLGIDVNLAPTLDVLTDAYSPNIGIRAYGKDPDVVASFGTARIRAMQAGGVSACAKHFPGKGHGTVDAHLGLPIIPSTWAEMEAVHLRPFRAAIEAGVDLVMTSHPLYPNLDPGPTNIATFSRKITHEYLREKVGYAGVIISDDLEMGAVRAISPIGEAGVRAVNAGHDLLLVCHELDLQREVYGALVKAYREGVCSEAALDASLARIEALQAKRPRRFEEGTPAAEAGGAGLAEEVCRKAVTVLNGAPIPSLAGKRVLVVFPRFSDLDQRIMIEREVLDEAAWVRRELGKHGVAPDVQVVGIEPTDAEIEAAGGLAAKADVAILFCYDARLYPSNRRLLETVHAHSPQPVIALLRDPYDVDLVREGVPAVTCFGWRACQMRAVIERIAADLRR
jgi:beta-N-acetylhexosaminidase